jgi:hypothetical protein
MKRNKKEMLEEISSFISNGGPDNLFFDGLQQEDPAVPTVRGYSQDNPINMEPPTSHMEVEVEEQGCAECGGAENEQDLELIDEIKTAIVSLCNQYTLDKYSAEAIMAGISKLEMKARGMQVAESKKRRNENKKLAKKLLKEDPTEAEMFQAVGSKVNKGIDNKNKRQKAIEKLYYSLVSEVNDVKHSKYISLFSDITTDANDNMASFFIDEHFGTTEIRIELDFTLANLPFNVSIYPDIDTQPEEEASDMGNFATAKEAVLETLKIASENYAGNQTSESKKRKKRILEKKVNEWQDNEVEEEDDSFEYGDPNMAWFLGKSDNEPDGFKQWWDKNKEVLVHKFTKQFADFLIRMSIRKKGDDVKKNKFVNSKAPKLSLNIKDSEV